MLLGRSLRSLDGPSLRVFSLVAGDRTVLSPAVNALVSAHQLDASAILGTGPKGRILKGDVLSFLQHPSAGTPSSLLPSSSLLSPSPSIPKPSSPPPLPSSNSAASSAASPPHAPAAFTDLPLTNVRRIIASRLSESKRTAPHAYLERHSRLDALLRLRKEVNAELSNSQQKPTSVNDWFVKAVAVSLARNPRINVSFDPKSDSIIPNAAVDICVAVAIPDGLITPIVQNPASKGIATLSSEIRSLAERAKANKLLPHEFQGGSFTISNLGMFGISSFKAVINPPQTAILAIGGSVARVVPAEDGSIQAANYVSYTLSYDVRAIEPEDAAQFLDDLDRIIENPKMGLL